MPQIAWKIQPSESWMCATCHVSGRADTHGNLTHRCGHPQIIAGGGPALPHNSTEAKRELTRPRYDLIPKEWLDCLAAIFEEGAKKYGDRNWEDGDLAYAKDCINHAWDHLLRLQEGDVSEDQLGKVAWNALAARYIRARKGHA